MSCIQIEIIQYKPKGGNPEVIQILQWSGKDIKIIMISMFKNLNDEIENCTGNYKKIQCNFWIWTFVSFICD